ncbi:MAG: zinc ABC transporter substrate-binding protein [Cyanobacteriota bacterium]|nr:zinc ABC transporter substrate-binding protein [Cyanobacteriota bacterium]
MFESKRFFFLWAIAMTMGMVGCASGDRASETTDPTATTSATTPATTSDLPEVVVSSSILCDLTEQIAGDRIALTCLMERDQDPHAYQTTPSDRQAMETAELILYDGYRLVPSIEELVEAIDSPAPKVAVYEAAVPEPILTEHHHHHGEGEHDEGEHDEGEHDEGEHHEGEHHEGEHDEEKEARGEELEPDPHVWHDVSNGMAVVEEIESQLAQVNPEQAPFYAENAQQVKAQLEALDTWVKEQVATIPPEQRTLVTAHDAFGYYIQAYGFEDSTALQGLSTDEQPTAAQVRELVEKIEAAQVPTIFAEVTTGDRVIETVAREAGIEVAEQKLYTGGLGPEGGDAQTYVGSIATNTCTIVNGLGGECTPFPSP